MSERGWSLTLALTGPCGERFDIAVPVDDAVIYEVGNIKPLAEYFPGELPMEQAVEVLRRREFRKDIFERHSARLGKSLAERMEDREGWHGASRKDRLKDWR